MRLLDANKNENDSMEYGKIMQGKSIGRISFDDNGYCEQEPSKNAVNNPCIEEVVKSPTSQITTQSEKQVNNTKLATKAVSTQKVYPQVSTINSIHSPPIPQKGEILGTTSKEISNTSSHPITTIPYLSSVSFSYSLLTIVSVFIKMKNA